MRKLQRLSMTVVFTLMLATGAFAGIIQTPVSPPDPPPATAPGIVQTGSPSSSDHQDSAAPSSALAGVALNLLQSLMLVF